ncbi:MAG: hypothetical protein Q4P33_04190 [Flaviflexus sp.]|nr:hypothetical protein [Flaviflexus sp.]
MDDIVTWAVKAAGEHPRLTGAAITASERWLDILLPSGAFLQVSPHRHVTEDMPERKRRKALFSAIDREIMMHSAGGDVDLDSLIPVLHNARTLLSEEFWPPARQLFSLPISRFLAVTLASPDGICVTQAQLDRAGIDDNHGLLAQGLSRMAAATSLGHVASGDLPGVFEVSTDGPYDTSWLISREFVGQLTTSLQEGAGVTGEVLYLPARHDQLYTTSTTNPALGEALETLAFGDLYPFPLLISTERVTEWTHPAIAHDLAEWEVAQYDQQSAYLKAMMRGTHVGMARADAGDTLTDVTASGCYPGTDLFTYHGKLHSFNDYEGTGLTIEVDTDLWPRRYWVTVPGQGA